MEMMAVSEFSADLLVLLQEFSRSGLREIHIRKDGFELFLSHDAAAASPIAMAAPTALAQPVALAAAPVVQPVVAPTPVAAPAQPAAAAPAPANAITIYAPTLGTFYRSPKPGAPAYVEIGKDVAAGDELCLIEVMKLFTSVTAKEPGRIHAILVDDGAMVEADQPLFVIERL
jgi:acetyl-CoA carboxylase biotin carboxyl carrier protein